jgi:hypothetical protein
MSWVFGPGGSATTPGGADQDIQFNNNGSFSGSNLLTTDGSGSLSASTHVSASTFYGDGSNLTGVTASAVQVADGPQYSLQFRFDSPVSGDLSGSANFVVNSALTDLMITGNVRVQEDYEFYGDLQGAVRFPAQNDEGAAISKGQVVYIKGVSGQTPTVALAACDDAAKMPAFGLAGNDAAQGAAVQIVTFGSLQNLDLSTLYGKTFAVGDTVFVETGSSGTSGSLTNVAPTGSGNLLQNMGKIVRNGGGGDGQIKVGGAGRTNATPNLDKGYIFVGNETDQAIQDSTIFVSASAERVGINVSTNLTAALHVSASSVHGGESARFEGEVVITSPEGKLEVQDTTNNYQVTLVPAIAPRVAFGTITDEDQYMVIDGGTTNRIVTVNDFYIASSSVPGNFNEGFYYDLSEQRFGIHTNAPSHTFTVNGDTFVTGAISASVGVSSSQVEVGSAFVGDVSANGVVVGFTDGQLISHGNFTFASDVLSVPTITASVGIQTEALEVTSSANGSINIGEGIIYTFGGLDRLDAFEGDIKLRNVNYYKAISTVQTTNFNIRDFQTFLVNTTGSVVTGTLPGLTDDSQIGLTYTIKDFAGSGSTNNVVIEPSGSQEIDGGTAAKIQTNYGAMTLTAFSSSHGYSWGIVSAT